MAKIKLSKKVIALIIACALVVLAGGCFGVTYAVLHRQLQTPVISVKNLSAEPDYTLDLVWDEVPGAISYTIEYKYSLYPDVTHTATGVAGTSLTIKRVKGEVQYRIKSVGRYSSNTSDFSEWGAYQIAPLELDAFRGFNFKIVEGAGYQIDMDTFSPVTYNYKGATYAINYYEIAAHSLEENVTEDELQLQTYSLLQLEEGVEFHFPSGTWNFYIRPVLYVDVNGVKDYTQIEGLYELYNEDIDYTIIKLTV
ncbi:MAG: hypothetical protein J6R44_03930 [Clostridia bacterium]|nr:hypothetical protein [Clostridia bacterium]MBO7177969.1 hypothetical protein [Clostridia bacterium]